MKSHYLLLIFVGTILFTACKEQGKNDNSSIIIGDGQMPNAVNIDNRLNIVYGTGDSIMYSSSSDGGKTFSSPEVVAVLPQLVASHMRGPQIAGTANGLTIIACNKPGDIFCYTKEGTGNWSQRNKVNDVDTTSKEGFLSLSADGQNTFAVWLDIRDRHNKIFGASSTDGGKTWSNNKLIYASPDSTVCECCKPSVVVNGKQVNVMFRNWLNGSRDLYLIQSEDNGVAFGKAKKLGIGTWPLNGCPMDGGGLALDENRKIQTVWHRQGKIYACEPGNEEKEIGAGRSCTLTIAGSKPIYAWTENGEVVCLLPTAERKLLGKGLNPVIKAIGNDKFTCIWEDEKQIHAMLINL